MDFHKFKDVSLAFSFLLGKFQTGLKNSDFKLIQSTCVIRATPALRKAIKDAIDIDSLFKLLSLNSMYFNWMNIKFLETIAAAVSSQNNTLETLVQKYKDAIYSRTLYEIWDAIPSYHRMKAKYCSNLQGVFKSKDPSSVTVTEVLRYCERSLIIGIALDIMLIEEHCLKITWLILTNEVYQAFLSLICIPQESREDDFLQVGAWVVHHPQFVLAEQRKVHG